ncbi:MAG: hypothetical protein AB8B80_11040 [Marinicellaceae bacterium]
MIVNYANHFKYIILSLFLFHASLSYASEIIIGQGNTVDLGDTDLQSEDLIIINQGLLNWGNGQHQISDFINQTSGISSAQNSFISLSQDWHNGGTFIAGSGTVSFNDLKPISRISGFTNFNELIATTASDKTLQFKEGTRQNIQNNIVLRGSSGNLLKITSSSETQEAYLGLNENASQSVDFINVANNHSVLQMLSPGQADISNSVQGPNVRGWFLTGFAFVIPTLSQLSVLILILITLLIAKNSIKKASSISGRK